MKKLSAFLLAFACLCSFAACGGGGENSDSSVKESGGGSSSVSDSADPGNSVSGDSSGSVSSDGSDEQTVKDNSGMIYDRYNLKTYLYPLWEGNTVYNETLWFAGSNAAPLLYEPDEILAVASYDLNTVYTEDVDYIVDGKEIYVTDNTSIPHLSAGEFYLSVPNNSLLPILCRDTAKGAYVYANEGSDISSRQVVVTYTHSDKAEWTLPRVETSKFPKTMQKLESGERIKVLFYGDSITVGANSSEFINYGPKAESYANMVKSYMAARYPAATIDFANNAVGGTDSNWGNGKLSGVAAIDNINASEGDHFQVRVLDENPDLLFIAYGMNDQVYDSAQYEQNIREMIEKAKAQNPEVEIMLVSGMIANPETYFYNKDYAAYQEALIGLSEEFEKVGVATVYNSVMSVYGAGKRFTDCTANNVNHPNDFMMRVYAQTVLYSLFGEDYIDHI